MFTILYLFCDFRALGGKRVFFLGCLAFALFFLSDYNDAKLHRKLFTLCFPLGSVLLILSVIFLLDSAASPVGGTFLWAFLWVVFLVFAALLVYTLFFSFPAASAYAAPGKKRPVYDQGFYALCRHPGVLWASVSLLCLWLAGGLPLYAAITYILLNVALVAFEDHYVFPIVLSGYEEYKRSIPFLIPTPNSIKTAFSKKRTGSVTGR